MKLVPKDFLPIVALGIGVLLSGFIMSVKLRPGNYNFKFSWKGNDFMGMMIGLYLAGVGVFGRDKNS